MPVPERHILVCTGEHCRRRGGKKLCKAFRGALEEAGQKRTVGVLAVDCLDQCGHGPLAVVYPDRVWYAGLREEDAQEIVDRHITAGKPVTACLHRRVHGPFK